MRFSINFLCLTALYIICEIPLEDIFLVATPLHSQNYICVNDGVITKQSSHRHEEKCWYNGTVLSDKAQRALRNEQVTIVANNTGFIHYAYPEFTIEPVSLNGFADHLSKFLTADRITYEVMANFLRQFNQYQKCFQICQEHHGKLRYLPIEVAFRYEHGNAYKVSDSTSEKLLNEIDDDEFYHDPIEHRICLGKIEQYLKKNQVHHTNKKAMNELAELMNCAYFDIKKILTDLTNFVYLKPNLPQIDDKTQKTAQKIELKAGMQRSEIIEYLQEIRDESVTADLAFYAYRDLTKSDWTPF